MQINFSPVKFNNIQYKKYPKLNQLPYDTVSFTAMKKSQFKGIDLAVVNMFNAPIEQYSENQDLQCFCTGLIDKIINKNYKGRTFVTSIRREAILNEWYKYVLDKDRYTKSNALFVLYGITKDLKDNDDRLPFELDKEVLSTTLKEINEEYIKNPKAQINFKKVYQKNLFLKANKNSDIATKTGWIVIPSQKHDSENFYDNVKKLQSISCHNWCTTGYNAKPYLENGDIHIYLENGKSKICVRFDDDIIEEIQGEKNDSQIPLKYLEIALDYIKGHKLDKDVHTEMKNAKKLIEEINKLRQKIAPKDFCDLSTKEILELFGIDVYEDEDKKLIISEYKQPSLDFTFGDLGIDENKMFEDIKEIELDADFEYSDLTNLSTLQRIGGNAYFMNSKIKTADNLRHIEGDANFNDKQVGWLKNIYIGGCINFNVMDFDDLIN